MLLATVRPTCSTTVSYAFHCFKMTSPYFVESTAVITRSGNKTVPHAGLATTLKTRMERRVLSAAASRAQVKLEEEDSSVSNQSLGRDASGMNPFLSQCCPSDIYTLKQYLAASLRDFQMGQAVA